MPRPRTSLQKKPGLGESRWWEISLRATFKGKGTEHLTQSLAGGVCKKESGREFIRGMQLLVAILGQSQQPRHCGGEERSSEAGNVYAGSSACKMNLANKNKREFLCIHLLFHRE